MSDYPTWLCKHWCTPLDEWPHDVLREYIALIARRIRKDNPYTNMSLCDAPIGTVLDIVWG